MNFNLIVAAATNNVIGKDNKLLWRLPNDLRYFKNLTWGLPVIMGRKTFESLPAALPGRKNIVLSHKSQDVQQAIFVQSVNDVTLLCNEMDINEAFVIGGGEVYKLFMPLAKKIYLTRVHTESEGDAYFPELDKKQWKLVHSQPCVADEKHAFDYTFEVWEK